MTTKETLDAVTPAAEPVELPAAPTASASKSADGALRADAVSLEVPVRVHGSHVIEATKDAAAHTEPFEESTSTMIIFPQGAVLRMSATVSVGQMIVVTNLKSGQDAICRIVKVRAYGPNQSYVETEFTHRQVGYWGVQFASDPAAASPKITLPKPDSREKSVTDQSARPLHGRSAFPSEFTLAGNKAPAQESENGSSSGAAQATDRKAGLSTASLGSAPSESADLSGGDAFPVAAESGNEAASSRGRESAASMFGSFGASSSLKSASASRELFGASASEEAVAESSELAGKKLLVIGGTALVLLLGAGGYFLFHQHASTPAALALATSPSPAVASNSTPASVAPSASPVTSLTQQTPPAVAATPVRRISSATPVSTASNALSVASSQTQPAVHDEAASHAAEAAPAAEAPAPHHAAAEVPSLFGVLNAHPVAPHSGSEQTQAAPDVDPSSLAAGAPAALPGIPPAQGSLAAPKFVSTPPRLLSSVTPVYPALARQMNVQGMVVINAKIEPNGTVGQMKVLSGSELLRQSALDALRRFKYEPGRVAGQPAETEITVTMNFSTK
jgi:TonB family protein